MGPHTPPPQAPAAPTNPTPDQAAAHNFLSELRTRIATQPLPFQFGVDARALESLVEIFGLARKAMKDHPGCTQFAAASTRMLNVDLRPVTAKWHRASVAGLLSSRDGSDAFRGDLQEVQAKLRDFASRLHEMAYGSKVKDDLTPPAISQAELDECLESVPFGIGRSPHIDGLRAGEINTDEAKEVRERRAHYHIATTEGMDAVGLALSGGGIRSATFCLGVVQVLANRDLLKYVDFLSTVSGGGYAGSFLTVRLGAKQPHADVAGPYGPDPEPIRFLRNHAKFLTAINLKQGWSMAIAALAGMLLNWTAPFFLVAVAALILPWLFSFTNAWRIVLAISGVLTVLALVLYGGLLRKGSIPAEKGGDILALLAALTLAIAACMLLAAGYGFVRAGLHSFRPFSWIGLGTLTLGGLAAAAPAILRFVPIIKNPTVRKIVLKVLLYVAAVAIPLGAIALFYAFWSLADLPRSDSVSVWHPLYYMNGWFLLFFLTVLLGFVALCLLNVNLTGPHRLYRDQLAKTFVYRSANDDLPKPLGDVNRDHTAPYHLINTALNLPSSESDKLRDRKSDFFLFSKHWCGAPTIDYHRTTQWRTNTDPVDLATAMAISGAAASPHMGLGSLPTLTALLTFLNARLGFWVHRPYPADQRRVPGFSCLVREMIGAGMSETHSWLNLSDGGHIENMAIYELLRRRCKYIVCVDGESDPGFTFQGYMTLVRHAQIDFGVHIESNLSELRPDPKTNRSQAHAVLCRIRYPDAGPNRPPATGLLLYIKLSLTGNEPELIKRYHIIHPDFPHQTTLDQFFDEEQFEAYRELAVHVADGVFSRALMSGRTEPDSVAQWFRQLAESLLESKRP